MSAKFHPRFCSLKNLTAIIEMAKVRKINRKATIFKNIIDSNIHSFYKKCEKSKPKACISLKFVYNEKVCVKHIFVGGKNL